MNKCYKVVNNSMWNTLREAVVITAYAVISDEILELMKKTADDTNE